MALPSILMASWKQANFLDVDLADLRVHFYASPVVKHAQKTVSGVNNQLMWSILVIGIMECIMVVFMCVQNGSCF